MIQKGHAEHDLEQATVSDDGSHDRSEDSGEMAASSVAFLPVDSSGLQRGAVLRAFVGPYQ